MLNNKDLKLAVQILVIWRIIVIDIPENLFYFKNRNQMKVIYTWYVKYFAIFKILFF